MCGQSPNSVLTSWLCHLRYSRITTHSKGLKQCAQGLHSSTTGLQRWRSMTLLCGIVQVKFRPMWTGSVAFQLVLHPQKTLYCIFRWMMRRKLAVWHRSYTQPHISEVKLCGSCLATAIPTKLAAESALRWPRVDYGHRQKTTGTMESKGPWDTLSVDIVGPLPADRRHEFVIVFVDCFSRYTVLVPASNHTTDTVSDALLRHVVPYFGTPRRLLSDRGREFVGEVWGKLTRSLGIQRLLTSPYHPEGNSINERSHRTMNNMLRARLLRDLPSRKWVVEIPGIMLALNAMVHEPHGFSASMIATGREPSLPPDLEGDACASPSTEDPVAYVDMVRPASRPHPPTKDPTSGSCGHQSIPRR